jgi:HEPN domain-containing protein
MPKHKEWLAFATDDFKAAQCMLHAEEIILGPALYHVQQCVEKSLKAFLIYKNQAPKRIHDLVELTHLCIEFDDSFEQLLEDAADLTPYATRTRYPDQYYSMPDVTTAFINLKQAKNILEFIENKIT